MWFSIAPWLCGSQLPRGYVVLNCPVVMWFSIAPWLCGSQLPRGYVVLNCPVVMWFLNMFIYRKKPNTHSQRDEWCDGLYNTNIWMYLNILYMFDNLERGQVENDLNSI